MRTLIRLAVILFGLDGSAAAQTIAINNISQFEGHSGTSDFIFDVTLNTSSGQTVTVDFTTVDGTATVADNDYIANNGTVTFLPGETSRPIVVEVVGDTTFEGTQFFLVNLSNPVNTTFADSQGNGTIVNDDVTIAINNVSLDEGDASLTDFIFDVTLSGTYSLTITADFSTSDGSATIADNDYIDTNGTVTFLPGETSQPVVVQVVGDINLEGTEFFHVNLSSAVNASFSDIQGNGTILNDDIIPTVSVLDASQVEGDAGTTAFEFGVVLSGPGSLTATVDYATSDGTATEPADYGGGSGTLTFMPGETTQAITVLVNGETTHENDETFFVDLSNPMNLFLGDAHAVGTIQNDDPLDVTIDDVALSEGEILTKEFVFTVSLSNPSEISASVDFATLDGSTSAGIDYLPGAGTLNFPPGTTSQMVAIQVVGDTDYEIDETFQVVLSNPVTGMVTDAQGLGMILNDDIACTPQAGPVTDLRLTLENGGLDLRFTWTDSPDSDSYILFENGVPYELFSSVTGAVSGAPGIVIPVPIGDRYYLLAAENAACGIGPRRPCAHDLCVAGPRLDSSCDLCVADICTADAACCNSGWSASCVEQVRTVCGSVRCPDSVGSCTHGVCTEGAALLPSCDDPPVVPSCVDAVCGTDPSCCSVTWGPACVAAVPAACGLTCD